MTVAANVERHLREIASRMRGAVEVGFLEDEVYPDGTPVAAVAYWNEFGTSTIPSRPFFRTMIAKESPSWPAKVASLAKSTGYDSSKVLALMGNEIADALKESINEWTEPPNAESTIKRKGFNKPLTDTSKMREAPSYRVIR